MPKRGPKCKLEYYEIFNYILEVLYTGEQWKSMHIKLGANGKPEIHYTAIYKQFARWSDDGSLAKVFEISVSRLYDNNILDITVLNGDGSNTVAKKGGDGIGYSGHKHQKGEKVLAIVDRNGYVVAPFTVAPVNINDCTLLPDSLGHLSRIIRGLGISIKGSVLNLDGIFDSRKNRKAIFNRGMIPNIPENNRNRKKTKRGRKRLFNKAIHNIRLAVERMFAWEDKFRKVITRFETKQQRHFNFKLLAYTMINIRHLCS